MCVEITGDYIDSFKADSVSDGIRVLAERYPSVRAFHSLDGNIIAMLCKPCGEPYEFLAYIRILNR